MSHAAAVDAINCRRRWRFLRPPSIKRQPSIIALPPYLFVSMRRRPTGRHPEKSEEIFHLYQFEIAQWGRGPVCDWRACNIRRALRRTRLRNPDRQFDDSMGKTQSVSRPAGRAGPGQALRVGSGRFPSNHQLITVLLLSTCFLSLYQSSDETIGAQRRPPDSCSLDIIAFFRRRLVAGSHVTMSPCRAIVTMRTIGLDARWCRDMELEVLEMENACMHGAAAFDSIGNLVLKSLKVRVDQTAWRQMHVYRVKIMCYFELAELIANRFDENTVIAYATIGLYINEHWTLVSLWAICVCI